MQKHILAALLVTLFAFIACTSAAPADEALAGANDDVDACGDDPSVLDCFETHEKNKSRQDVTVRECKLVFEKCIADRSKVVVGTAA